jgi:hypothetical protein
MSVVGTAQPSTDVSTRKSRLVFNGRVGGTTVAGTLPLPPGHGQTYTSTGTIRVG